METVDLLIVGGGPAGLCAAINGASEGLRVRMLDNGAMLGGQARESRAIENYPGFPRGITGNDLMTAFIEQAHKFETLFNCPWAAVGIERQPDGLLTVHTDVGQEVPAHAVLLATGLQYSQHTAKGVGRFMGRGVWYGLPNGTTWGKRVVVVGGANSAGQAALALAVKQGCEVTMLSRSPLEKSMSTYLVTRIKTHPQITVLEGAELLEVCGVDRVQAVTTTSGTFPADGIFMFIGARPRTFWLRGSIALETHGYVPTDMDVRSGLSDEHARLPFETSMRGVFAAGDVRSGSTKRITVACGEGATALQMIHRRLGE